MNYRSVADLARVIRENLHRVPADVDLVVGVPRSGLLAASLISLHLNLKLTDLPSLRGNTPLQAVNIRTSKHAALVYPQDAQHILLVDDSLSTGASMAAAKRDLSELPGSRAITSCVVFTTAKTRHLIDLAFEDLPLPRVFEWNVMHHRSLSRKYCVDVDGAVCLDPTPDQNDDGDAYRDFLCNATPLCLPTYPVGHLVTSRLEKYRAQTEAWLKKTGIEYGRLHMLDLPDMQTRRRLKCHAAFKAEVYRNAEETVLFIESDRRQAAEIARLSGKPVLCFSTQELLNPELSLRLIEHKSRKLASKILNRFYPGQRRPSG